MLDLLKAVGFGITALFLLGIGLSLWLPKKRENKLYALWIVCFLAYLPVCKGWEEVRQQRARESEHSARHARAQALFNARCKSAGEKIYRTVDNVDGLLLTTLRPVAISGTSQYGEDDQYGFNEGGVIASFTDLRANGSASKFTDAAVLALYRDLKSTINGGASLLQIQDAHSRAMALLNVAPGDTSHPRRLEEAQMLVQAIDRVQLVFEEALRAPGLSSGNSSPGPNNVPTGNIDATKLDYQLAVLFSQQATQASTGPFGGAQQGILGRAHLHRAHRGRRGTGKRR